MAKLKIGVFGGGRGMVAIRQLLNNPDAELVAVCDVLPQEEVGLYDLEGNYIGTFGNANYLNLSLHILTVLTIIAIVLATITLKSSTTKKIDSEIILKAECLCTR